MSWKNFRRPALRWTLLSLAFSLQIASVQAEEPAPVSYRHLDWITKEEIAALPPEQRPTHVGMCSGVYVQPGTATSSEGAATTGRIHASADSFDTTEDGRLVLNGNVMVSQEGRELGSDQVRINRTSGESELQGNVSIRQPGLLIRGETAYVNNAQNKVDRAQHGICCARSTRPRQGGPHSQSGAETADSR